MLECQTETAPFGGAVYSRPPTYRYRLWRDLRDPLFPTDRPSLMTFVLLNPSTATARVDDPTIRRCIGYARRERMDMLEIVNLFALRATNPRELWRADDPIGGATNNEAILDAAGRSALIVCGWGGHGSYLGRQDEVADLLGRFDLRCLGRNDDGSPVHPLYQPKTACLRAWEPPR